MEIHTSTKPGKKIKAVVFDAFGTLVEITDYRRPFRKLLSYLDEPARASKAENAELLMSRNVGLAGAAALFNLRLSIDQIADLELDLLAETASTKVFADAVTTLNSLKNAGYKLGVCSNLAAPYAVPVKLLLPFELDAYGWSFEVGATKPHEAIYKAVCKQLNCSPSEVLMVGDTYEADCIGPQRHGLQGLHLARNSEKKTPTSISSLSEIIERLG